MIAQLYTLEDLAKILKKSKSTVNKRWKQWSSEGRIGKPLLVEGRPRFYEKDIEKLLKSFES